MRPNVSVVVPAFNAESYIESTIRALLTQTLKNIEIICVNDGSKDKTLDILNKLSEDDSRVVVVDSVHKGAGGARNQGILKSKGEYIIFLDADDLFDPFLCEEAYNNAKDVDADVLFWDFEISSEMKSTRKQGHNTFPERVNLANELYFSFRMTNPACWTKIYKREFVVEQNLQFQLLPTCNDIAFCWLSLAYARRLYYLNKVLVYYRTGIKGQISSNRHLYADSIFIASRHILKGLLSRASTVNLVDVFYRDIMQCMLYEYRCIPSSASSKRFIENATNFFPIKHRKLFKSLIFRDRKHTILRNIRNFLRFWRR